jgi:hypothetical protein
MTNKMKKILAIGFAAIGIALFADTAMAAETSVWTTLNVSVGYRNTSAGEHRPYVGGVFRLLSGDLNIDSASRIELSGFDTLSGRTALDMSTQIRGITLSVSDELRANVDGITGNRASIGITKGVNDTVSVTAFYMLDSTGNDLSSTAHVLGLGLGVSL